VARHRLRSQNEVAERCQTLRTEVRSALEQVVRNADDAAVVDGVWRGEALGTLLWAVGLVELPPYDQPFDAATVVAIDTGSGTLRPPEEIELERDTARLWHWRARTSELQAAGGVELPARYSTFDQLIAATAMRGHEQGLLPAPSRGDFQAYGKVYRHLDHAERDEAHSIAVERHQALNWLCGLGETWDDVPLDT
jgi:Domain of unknown function (DUF4272)